MPRAMLRFRILGMTNDASPGAVAGQVDCRVRPAPGATVPTYEKKNVTHWNCSQCEKPHTFSAYVAAHWRDELTHTCDNCGAQHSVCCGRVQFERA